MASKKDVENGNGSVSEPLIDKRIEAEEQCQDDNGDLGMVYLSTFVAVCGSFEFGSCVGYSSPTQFGIMKELGLSYSEFSVFGSIFAIGAMLGAITSGRIADFIGRKGAMRLSSIVCISGWFAIYLASGCLLLDIGRLLTGFGVGVFSYVVPVFIAEITPKELRGALATANQLLITVGMLVAYAMGSYVSWRALALTGSAPCMVVLVGLCFIPESPRWLAMVGRHQEFDTALRKLRGPNANILQEEADIQESITMLQELPKVTMLDLINKRNIRFVIIGVGLMVIQQFAGINGIVYYASQIFLSAGVSPAIGSILYASLQVVLTAFGAFLMDRAGRRPLLMVSLSGMFLGCILTGLSFLFKENHIAHEYIPILAAGGVLVYIGFFSIGIGPIPWVIMSEIFPINVKGAAGSLVTLVNWIGSWAVSYSFYFLMEWSSYGVFFAYGSVCAAAIVFTIKLVPETKGRTLEEIQTLIK